VDTKWSPETHPLAYDMSAPPRVVGNVTSLLGGIPDSANWYKQGVLCLAIPMYIPVGGTIERFTAVWQGWISELIKGVKGLPHKKDIGVLLMGRRAGLLERQFGAGMRIVKSVDPTQARYVYQENCPFKTLNNDIQWMIS
jgi:hypothetical protein